MRGREISSWRAPSVIGPYWVDLPLSSSDPFSTVQSIDGISGLLRTRANLLHANNANKGLLDFISYKNGKWLAVRSSPSLEVVPSQYA
jgi:hypothetical protein